MQQINLLCVLKVILGCYATAQCFIMLKLINYLLYMLNQTTFSSSFIFITSFIVIIYVLV